MIRDEINHVVLGMGVSYEGLFSLADLIIMVDSFFRKRGYTKHVMSHKEQTTKTGRTVSLRLRPFRPVKKNKLEVQARINITDLKEVDQEIDGIKVRMNSGKISITVDGFVIENLRGDFDTKPTFIFITTLFNKFLFKQKSRDYAGMVKKDAVDFRNEIESFLHLNKYLY